MAFPEEGPNATHRVHFHCVLFCYDADLDLDTFRECCKYHWHAVSGNTRFPEGEHEEKKWFDSVIDSKIVARYVAKYVAKDKLKDARVMASHGFNWSETVVDIVLANRDLVEQPGPENGSAEFEYESPHNRETLSEEVGHTDWVGLELDTISHAIETDSPSGVSVVDTRKTRSSSLKASVIAVVSLPEKALHPASAKFMKVNSQALDNDGVLRNFKWFPREQVESYRKGHRVLSEDTSLSEFFTACEQGLAHAVISQAAWALTTEFQNLPLARQQYHVNRYFETIKANRDRYVQSKSDMLSTIQRLFAALEHQLSGVKLLSLYKKFPDFYQSEGSCLEAILKEAYYDALSDVLSF